MAYRHSSRSVAVLAASMLLGPFWLGSSGAVKAQSGSFYSEVRIDCRPGSSGSARIQLFKDGVADPEGVLSIECTDGEAAKSYALTTTEPNGWQIGGSVSSPVIGIPLLCGPEAGTRFPAVYQCGAGNAAVHVMVFRPRHVNVAG